MNAFQKQYEEKLQALSSIGKRMVIRYIDLLASEQLFIENKKHIDAGRKNNKKRAIGFGKYDFGRKLDNINLRDYARK